MGVAKTILLDMPTNFVLGFVLMWLGRHELRSQPRKIWTVPFQMALGFSLFVFCPITLWSFYAYPAWATVYLRPEFLIPWWSGPLIVSHYFLGMVFGALLAQFLLQYKKEKPFWVVFALGLFWLLCLVILTWDEYNMIGTYNSYHAGAAQPIQENSTFMRDLNLMGIGIAVPGIAIAYLIFRRSQKLRPA